MEKFSLKKNQINFIDGEDLNNNIKSNNEEFIPINHPNEANKEQEINFKIKKSKDFLKKNSISESENAKISFKQPAANPPKKIDAKDELKETQKFDYNLIITDICSQNYDLLVKEVGSLSKLMKIILSEGK